MSKFIQRIGTASTKFAIEVHLTKVEISLVQQCSISVVFKRGEHVKETKPPAALEHGIAVFDQKLSIPATLYYDKKKDGYLPKEATLSLNIITPSTTRLAGITKLDLAAYANLNLQEQDVILKVDKCFDKKAKFYFTLKLMQLTDTHSKGTHIAFPRKNIQTPKANAALDRLSMRNRLNTDPNRSGALYSEPSMDLKGIDGFSSIHNMNMSAFDTSKMTQAAYNRRTRSPTARNEYPLEHEQTVKNRRSRTVEAGKDDDESDIGEHHDPSPFFSQAHSQNHIPVIENQLEERVAELEEQVKSYQNENRHLEDRASTTQQEYQTLKTEFERMKEVYEKMKGGWSIAGQNETKQTIDGDQNDQKAEIEARYKENQKELEGRIDELSEQIKQLINTNQELEDQNSELKSRAEEKEHQNSQGPSSHDYEHTIQDLRTKLKATEERLNESETFLRSSQAKTQDVEKQTQSFQSKLQQAEARAKTAEQKVNEVEEARAKEIKNKDKRLHELEDLVSKNNVDSEDKRLRVEDLEAQVISYETEIESLKKLNRISMNDQEEVRKVKEQLQIIEKKNKTLEEGHKKRVEELSKQNADTKKELEHVKGLMNSKQVENENTLAHVSMENDKLKRQVKEFNAKFLTMQYEGNELEHLRETVKELKARNEYLESENGQLKTKCTALVVEKDSIDVILKESEDNNRLRQDRLDILEMQLFKLKAKFSELVNEVMEAGDEELLDQMEKIIAAEDIEYYRNSNNRTPH